MAIQVADNFSYKGGKPLDARSKYATLAAMKAAAEADLYDGCMAYVDADGKYYTFNSSNTVDATTGKWRVFESGGGASDLADLGDVNLTSPTNGQVLKYDAVNEKWVNDNVQVPTFANSFSRSDILSTTEKIVGTDTDGMPIYQKTEVVSNPTKDSWISFGTSLTGCNIIGIFGSLLFSNGLTFDVPYNSGDSYVYINKKTDADGGELVYKISAGGNVPTLMKVTLRYTKTGDTPIKVGTGNDYSTDEQIVGSWIDGKPVYQKTLLLDGSYTGNVNNIFDLGSDKIVISIDGVGISTNDYIMTIPNVNAAYSDDNFGIFIDSSGHGYYRGGTSSTYKRLVITLRYTKTTD